MNRPQSQNSADVQHAREWMKEKTEQERAERLKQASAALRQQQPAQSYTTRHREPPAETGQRLGTLKRGEEEEVRINWDEYKGHNFLSIKLWRRDSDGGWWPDKSKGITIKVRELSDFSESIVAALEAASERTDPEVFDPPF